MLALFDDFNRTPNPLYGSLGAAPTGQLWAPSGASLPIISNNNLITTGSTGSYAFIDVQQPPKSQDAVCAWNTSSDGCVIISSNLDFNLNHIIHVVFNFNNYVVQVRRNAGVFETIYAAAYQPSLVLGRLYAIGLRYESQCLTVKLPNNTTRAICHDNFAGVSGRYLGYQPIGDLQIKYVLCTT